MAIISIPFTFSAGAVIVASQHNSNFSTIYSDYNGNVDNTNIVASAGIAYSKLTLTGAVLNADLAGSIADSKLLQITTAAKVSGAAITLLTSLPSGAGIIPTANLPSFTGIPSNIQVFTSSGTWTKPANISNAYVKVIGGGGAGGAGANNAAQGAGGGGGAGGYAEGIIAVTGNVTVTIGATNSFAGTTTIQATSGSTGEAGQTTRGGAGGAGGVGSNGILNLTGSMGGNGGFSASGLGGNGATSVIGGGGAGGTTAASGSAGQAYGGGGGGGGSTNNGNGGGTSAGAVIVYY